MKKLSFLCITFLLIFGNGYAFYSNRPGTIRHFYTELIRIVPNTAFCQTLYPFQLNKPVEAIGGDRIVEVPKYNVKYTVNSADILLDEPTASVTRYQGFILPKNLKFEIVSLRVPIPDSLSKIKNPALSILSIGKCSYYILAWHDADGVKLLKKTFQEN